MYNIVRENFGDFYKIKLLNEETGAFLSVVPEFGANITELVLVKNGKKYSIIEGDTSYEDLIKNRLYRGAKLIPYPNRVKDGKFTFNGETHQLPIDFPSENTAIHGLIFNKTFRVADRLTHKNAAEIVLKYKYQGDFKGFPFRFKIKLKYSISDDGFTCTTIIKNNDSIDVPIGDGWHPYFKVTGKVDDLSLKLPSNQVVEVDERKIPTGAVRTYDKFEDFNQIGAEQFDTGFILENIPGIVSTELRDKNEDVTVSVWQETGLGKYNFLQVYIPDTRESIAIEPMSCKTNALNNKDGLVVLHPGEAFTASYGVKIY